MTLAAGGGLIVLGPMVMLSTPEVSPHYLLAVTVAAMCAVRVGWAMAVTPREVAVGAEGLVIRGWVRRWRVAAGSVEVLRVFNVYGQRESRRGYEIRAGRRGWVFEIRRGEHRAAQRWLLNHCREAFVIDEVGGRLLPPVGWRADEVAAGVGRVLRHAANRQWRRACGMLGVLGVCLAMDLSAALHSGRGRAGLVLLGVAGVIGLTMAWVVRSTRRRLARLRQSAGRLAARD